MLNVLSKDEDEAIAAVWVIFVAHFAVWRWELGVFNITVAVEAAAFSITVSRGVNINEVLNFEQ